MRVLQVGALAPDLAGVSLVERPVPLPGPGEVLVRVRAVAIGFPDLLMTHGGYQTRPALPFTGGMDVAGEVAMLGEGVDHLAIGDSVIALSKGGGFAEYGAFPAAKVFRKPTPLTFPQAAALGSAYLTAYVGLLRCARIEPGEWLLVHGAAGGVGLAAVDLGQALGARVIAAASSPAKREAIAGLHAPEHVVDSAPGFRDAVMALTGGSGADVVFDPVGGDVFAESMRCIAFGGRLLVVGFAGGGPATVATNIALIKGFSVVGVRAGEYGRRFPERGRENLRSILALAETGAIRPHVHATLPLEAWRDGFEMMRKREVVGRVVLLPGGEEMCGE